MVHEAAVWGPRECDGFLVDALARVLVGEDGLASGGEGGPAPVGEDGPAPGGEGGPASGGEGGPAPVGEGGPAPGGEGGLAPGGEGGLAPEGEGGPVPGGEGGPVPGGEGGDSLFLQIVGLVLHYCSLVEVAVGSSGCVWDQTVPFLPVAMVCQGRRRSKV